ncbi:LruC domain-containing protein [Bacteroides sp. OttesenSCG-928-J23]|nr:LruC domain-containing protein [Bacteroides sp. OttesenSCG-928-J23]
MKQLSLFKSAAIGALSISLALFAACSDRDYYVPNNESNEAKSFEELFDFSTRAEISVNLNYGLPGCRAFFSIYAENPLNEVDGKLFLKEDIQPLYSAFTTENNTFNGKVALPTALKKVYLYTGAYALPSCVALQVTPAGIAFNNTFASAQTRAQESPIGTSIPAGTNYWQVTDGVNLYRLYNSIGNRNAPTNTEVAGLYATISATENISSTATESTIGALLTRVQNVMGDPNLSTRQNNSGLVTENTNIAIKKKTLDGKDVESAHLDLVFLNSNPGGYKNVLGYYYYKTGETPSASELKALPKYLLFPKLEKVNGTSRPNPGIKVRLQYFGENYDEAGTDEFPSGYSIGWMLIPNTGTDSYDGTTDNSFNSMHNLIVSKYNETAIYSNYYAANQKRQGFVTLRDAVSGKMVIGIEDTTWEDHGVWQPNNWHTDSSYEDLLFYVDADPIEAIHDEDDDIIEDDEIIKTDVTTGILAFEDIWPDGGDYDMNDVVVKYTTTVTFNQKNEIKSITDSFEPIHDGADYKNAFGYQINSEMGTIDQEKSNFHAVEENNQIILFPNAKVVQNQTFTVTRNFQEGSYPDKEEYVRNYNPFIVVNYIAMARNRIEVHLPKFPSTNWASTTFSLGDNSYFINVDGKFPFAIDLATATYSVPVEKTNIGVAYPEFNSWATSGGTTNEGWYDNPSAEHVQ